MMHQTSESRSLTAILMLEAALWPNDGLISPVLLLLKYENSLFRIELKEKKISKTSDLNFSENLNKEQLDINFNQ